MLGDTLIEKFTADEIETVLAHEFGHLVHKDVTLGIIVQSILTLIGFWLADFVMRWGIAAFDYSGLTDPATWVEVLLHSHPSISKRVAMTKTFEDKSQLSP